ncbi:MAG: hypothetical protein IJS47_05450 [Clostridia bacterium]|nr:hypothetical protein [Clostridia bacterium]
MKKNVFDPFMQVNFTSSEKQSKPVQNISQVTGFSDSSETLFLDKKIAFRPPCVMQGFVVLVKSKSIGSDNVVGGKLLKDIILEMVSMIDLPEYIILANDAVELLKDDRDILNTLKNMKRFGTKVVLSKESMEYFKIAQEDFSYKWSSSEIAQKVVLSKRFLEL